MAWTCAIHSVNVVHLSRSLIFPKARDEGHFIWLNTKFHCKVHANIETKHELQDLPVHRKTLRGISILPCHVGYIGRATGEVPFQRTQEHGLEEEVHQASGVHLQNARHRWADSGQWPEVTPESSMGAQPLKLDKEWLSSWSWLTKPEPDSPNIRFKHSLCVGLNHIRFYSPLCIS